MNKYLFAFLFPLFGIVYAVFACFRYAYKFVLKQYDAVYSF